MKDSLQHMELLKGQDALEALCSVLPYIVKALPPDMALYVTDGKKYLQAAEGENLNIGIETDSEIVGKATERCMQENRKTVFNVRIGTPFRGVNIPVPDENGNPVGTVICAIGRETQQDVNAVAEQLSNDLDQIAATVEETAIGAGRLAEVGQTLFVKVQESNQKLSETEVIINTIKKISTQTNMLGLNAAIESARVGEHGRGFGVVAQEIRKLAENSKIAVEEARQIIESISFAVNDMTGVAEESGQIAQQQAAATQENAATIEHLRKLAETVKDTAARL